MGYFTNVSFDNGSYIGIITKDGQQVFITEPSPDATLVQNQLTNELHKISAMTPRATKKVSANTLRTTNSVNILRAKTPENNTVPVPLEDVGTYVPKPQLTVAKSPQRKCCGRR